MRLSTTAGVAGSGAIPFPAEVSFLVVAGGGSSYVNSGGGAGGYRSSWNNETSGGGSPAESAVIPVQGTSYTVTVGAGGSGSAVSGSNSVFADRTSLGGGRSGGPYPDRQGRPGGSGGGAFVGSGGAGTAGQGYSGGSGSYANYTGGGGGAGQAGQIRRNRAAGQTSTISGSSVMRATGGAGSDWADQSGIAGASAGGANTGDGADSIFNGGSRNGGSGIVILRFYGLAPTVSAGLTYTETSDGGDTILTFTAGTGTVTW